MYERSYIWTINSNMNKWAPKDRFMFVFGGIAYFEFCSIFFKRSKYGMNVRLLNTVKSISYPFLDSASISFLHAKLYHTMGFLSIQLFMLKLNLNDSSFCFFADCSNVSVASVYQRIFGK